FASLCPPRRSARGGAPSRGLRKPPRPPLPPPPPDPEHPIKRVVCRKNRHDRELLVFARSHGTGRALAGIAGPSETLRWGPAARAFARRRSAGPRGGRGRGGA